MLCRKLLCFFGFTAIAVGFNLDSDSTATKGASEVSKRSEDDSFEDWTRTSSDKSDERGGNLFKESEPTFDESKDPEELFSEEFEDTGVVNLANLGPAPAPFECEAQRYDGTMVKSDSTMKKRKRAMVITRKHGGSVRQYNDDITTHHRYTITVSNGEREGTWGEAEFCREGSYAIGYDLKIQHNQGNGDDSALNAIQILCEYPDGTYGGAPTSKINFWGDWQGRRTCRRNNFLTKFQLQVEKWVGRGVDDTSANFVRFKCRGDGGEYDLSLSRISGYGEWGEYGDWSDSCPRGQAICGIQTKVTRYCLFSCYTDETSLNDVKFYCCELSKYECKT